MDTNKNMIRHTLERRTRAKTPGGYCKSMSALVGPCTARQIDLIRTMHCTLLEQCSAFGED